MNEINFKLLDTISSELNVNSSSLSLSSGPDGDIAEWDSFAHVTLMLAIEVSFGVKFTIDELAGLNSVEKIQQRLNECGCL